MAFKFFGGIVAAGLSLKSFSNTEDIQDPYWRTKSKIEVKGTSQSEFLIYSGNSNKPLSKEIASYLNTSLGTLKLSRFADGEINLQIYDSLRNKDCFLVQSTCPPVNEHLMELLLMISTMRRAGAKKITAVIPYYGYARQDRKMMSRVPISAADVAKLLETVGVDRVISCDLHCGQIQGFFGPRIPVDNLESSIVGLKHFEDMQLVNPVVVSPDAGGVYRAKKFQGFMTSETTSPGLAMIIKQRIEANQVDRMDLVGDVENCDCIIVDDMIDTAGTLCKAAEVLKQHGARRVIAFATHGLFSKDALEKIEESPLDQVVITNTIPLPSNTDTEIPQFSRSINGPTNKIKQISVGMLLAEAIRRAHQKESFSQLFYPKSFKGD